MKVKLTAAVACLVPLVFGGCSHRESTEPADNDSGPTYYVVDESLARIRADFNAMEDRIRLVFIVGPSCGICLRGMDDLNESIVKRIQGDSRVQTMVIHVPTLGAEEKHVIAAIPLLAGPRVTHYWDPAGTTGRDFQEALDLPMYGWDLWFIYEPGARWEDGELPPVPAYWEHQLPGLPAERKLDGDRFAAEVTARLAELPPLATANRLADAGQVEAGILPVAQPLGVMIAQNHRSRGGYERLKAIDSIRYEGTTEIDGSVYPLTLETRRPDRYVRRAGSGNEAAIVSWDGAALAVDGPPRLPADFLKEFLASYDFDGWMTEWKDKGYQLSKLGMEKLGDRLPWLLEVKLSNGRTWRIYVDSHTGDAFRSVLLDEEGAERIRIDYADYRTADGFRLPHRIQYFEEGRLLATDRFSAIEVAMAADARDTGS
jgi:hypothetical protein